MNPSSLFNRSDPSETPILSVNPMESNDRLITDTLADPNQSDDPPPVEDNPNPVEDDPNPVEDDPTPVEDD
ncbi:MAG: hypothetical protein ACQERW_11610, partial [Cyanobacteriota bacterium]